MIETPRINTLRPFSFWYFIIYYQGLAITLILTWPLIDYHHHLEEGPFQRIQQLTRYFFFDTMTFKISISRVTRRV